MAGLRIHTVMPSELVGRIDAAASSLMVSRGEFVRRAVEQALGSPGSPDAVAGVRGRVPAPVPAEQPRDERALSEAEEPTSWEQADPGSVSFSEGVRSAAPARPRVRSSAAARPFRPAPKKGEK